jgi:hypothetical protein
VLLFKDPALASLLAWCVAMTSRQAGHFFFEPKGYDHFNQASQDYKEEIKIGYNLFRKVVFMTMWALMPLLLLVSPTLFGLFPDPRGSDGSAPCRHHVAGARRRRSGVPHGAALLHPRRDVRAGLGGARSSPIRSTTSAQYRHAPIRLLKGERLDGITASMA